ncbi:conserved hypothetical protein [Ricinus communis]|uniref:Uncharacterized protein n=1 Tax=Ricinus communis TaxID=3988 RepID=B9RVA2_RICCO|nr:conserved hypothetical protein [Ricinus communis]
MTMLLFRAESLRPMAASFLVGRAPFLLLLFIKVIGGWGISLVLLTCSECLMMMWRFDAVLDPMYEQY